MQLGLAQSRSRSPFHYWALIWTGIFLLSTIAPHDFQVVITEVGIVIQEEEKQTNH